MVFFNFTNHFLFFLPFFPTFSWSNSSLVRRGKKNLPLTFFTWKKTCFVKMCHFIKKLEMIDFAFLGHSRTGNLNFNFLKNKNRLQTLTLSLILVSRTFVCRFQLAGMTNFHEHQDDLIHFELIVLSIWNHVTKSGNWIRPSLISTSRSYFFGKIGVS